MFSNPFNYITDSPRVLCENAQNNKFQRGPQEFSRKLSSYLSIYIYSSPRDLRSALRIIQNPLKLETTHFPSPTTSYFLYFPITKYYYQF